MPNARGEVGGRLGVERDDDARVDRLESERAAARRARSRRHARLGPRQREEQPLVGVAQRLERLDGAPRRRRPTAPRRPRASAGPGSPFTTATCAEQRAARRDARPLPGASASAAASSARARASCSARSSSARCRSRCRRRRSRAAGEPPPRDRERRSSSGWPARQPKTSLGLRRDRARCARRRPRAPAACRPRAQVARTPARSAQQQVVDAESRAPVEML